VLLDFFSNLDSGTTRWAVGIIGVILFLFLVASRKRSKKQAEYTPGGQQEDLIIEWEGGADGQIAPQDWMTNPDVRAVINAIEAGGKEIRFVGGCVRDAILHREVSDVDLATSERPERVVKLMEDAGLKAIPTGIEHGTVTAFSGEHTYQITTLRKDVKTDGRHAEVVFTNDWIEDAARRDFTFNTMSATPDGMVYDHFNGMQDLANRRIHFVGKPEERILEDHLRILRYFRFIAVLGMRIDDQSAYQKCIQHAPLLKELSGERIRDEFFKMLNSENNFDAIGIMVSSGVAEHFLPEAVTPILLERLMWLETSAMKFETIGVDPIRRLASFLETDADGARAIAERLRLSNVQRDQLIELIEPQWQATWDITDDELRALLYRLNPSCVIDLCLLEWSRILIDTPRIPREQMDAWLHIIETADAWIALDFPLRGRDALELGLEEGPRISEVLEEVEDWWTTGGCRADRAACLEKLREVVGE